MGRNRTRYGLAHLPMTFLLCATVQSRVAQLLDVGRAAVQQAKDM